jgi:methylenetetrahydrofolate--tRNA-(uracil-5-)-methyltransferase
MGESVMVIGGGLAGCEAAVQLGRRGIPVEIWEMKPSKRTPAQRSDHLCELVCSNSLRSDNPENAVGLLKAELRALDSPILAAADATRVPAGDALAVDRERFAAEVERTVLGLPNLTLRREERVDLPPEPQIALIATGPLTSQPLSKAIQNAVGGDALYFYDAIAPIVSADSVDLSIAFAQSRYGKGGGEDYLNLPLDREQYRAFVRELRSAEKVAPHDFEEARYFEGCLPIEVLAERGEDALAFGPMKPVGLVDPHTGRRPHAVVQLRHEDVGGTAYNLVGFQTRLTWPEQKRVLRSLPGLAAAEFLRLGQVHRNTFLKSPAVLAADLSLRTRPTLFFGGQITGVEGYVESCACGLLAALSIEARVRGRPFVPPPATTALGALYRHVTGEAHPQGYDYQPSNVIFGLFPAAESGAAKGDRRARMVARARHDFGSWAAGVRVVA